MMCPTETHLPTPQYPALYLGRYLAFILPARPHLILSYKHSDHDQTTLLSVGVITAPEIELDQSTWFADPKTQFLH